MASATGTKQQQHPDPAPPPGAAVVNPEFEWAEKAGSYVLRLTLQGFKKDDFRVQVDGAGRLTVRGTRPGASLHKVFQLPSAAILDNIAGRFEAGVLTLTVPKRAGAPKGDIAPNMAPTEQVDGAMKTGDADGEKKAPKPAPSSAVAPASMEEIRAKPKEEGAKKMPAMDDDDEKEGVTGVEPKESVLSRTARLVAEQVRRMEEEAKRRKQEQQKPAPAAKKEQEVVEVKPKTPQAAAYAVTPKKPASDEMSKAVVEEERAKAATAATFMEAREEQEKKATATTFTAWKERMTEGLGQLTDMKWADGAVEMARKNKELVAVGIAAFSLGFFISHRLFRK